MIRDDDAALTKARERIRALGARFDAEVLQRSQEAFESLVRLDHPDVTVSTNHHYGPDERQVLDAFVPAHPSGEILVFVPGGGFVGGGKNETPAFYRNLGVYFASYGFLTVVGSYRLLPDHGWVDQVSDVAALVEWVHARADGLCAGAQALNVMGASAGAANLSSFLYHPQFRDRATALAIRRAILINGVYHFHEGLREGLLAVAGGPEHHADRSALHHVTAAGPVAAIGIAELDSALAAAQSLALADRLNQARGSCPPLLWWKHHNHVSCLYSLGSSDDSVGRSLREFLND